MKGINFKHYNLSNPVVDTLMGVYLEYVIKEPVCGKLL